MNNTMHLAHHGVKGQKWGKRRYQYEDGSLTPEGEIHYGVGEDHKTSKIQQTKERLKSSIQQKSNARKLELKKHYIEDKGYLPDEAEEAVEKRLKTEKIVKAALGLSVAAVATYGAYKYYDYAFDKTLTTKTTLSRVTASLKEGGNRGVYDAFYAVYDKSAHDKRRYSGYYAQQLKEGYYGPAKDKIYEKKIGFQAPIKLASTKNARAVFEKYLNANPKAKADLRREFGIDLLDGHILKRSDYDVINRYLARRDLESTKSFYRALREAGYGAVIDVNDQKYSGFGTKYPIIVFDERSPLVKSVRQLGSDEIEKGYKKVQKEMIRDAAIETLSNSSGESIISMGMYACIGGAVLAYTSKQYDSYVTEYRKEHPNSKKTRAELIADYKESIGY